MANSCEGEIQPSYDGAIRPGCGDFGSRIEMICSCDLVSPNREGLVREQSGPCAGRGRAAGTKMSRGKRGTRVGGRQWRASKLGKIDNREGSLTGLIWSLFSPRLLDH